MIPGQLQPLANHLFQSTLFAAMAGLLALALRRNRAQIRYCLWLTASIKFYIPFSLLVAAGSHFAPHTAPKAALSIVSPAIEQIAQSVLVTRFSHGARTNRACRKRASHGLLCHLGDRLCDRGLVLVEAMAADPGRAAHGNTLASAGRDSGHVLSGFHRTRGLRHSAACPVDARRGCRPAHGAATGRHSCA